MKRFSKILSAVLLLAIALSAFGVFSVFAEDTASDEAAYGTFIKDPDSAIGSVSGSKVGQPSIVERKDVNGKTYYTIGFNGVDPGEGDYVSVNFATGKTAENGIRVGNYEFADGSTVEKNTDYMVVDFDISTDTTYIDGLYFHTAFYNDVYTHAKRYQPKPLYFDLDGEDNESFSIGLNSDASAAYAYAPYAEDVWQHVTFVYDFRDTSSVSVHFYINGIYSGSKTGINISSALTLYFFRITTPVQTLDSASTNIANFSVKRFEAGYDGPLTGDRVLANIGSTLNQIPDLAYCLESAPETEAAKLADVVKADGTSFTAYKTSDLNARLASGDKVTLYRNLTSAVIVPAGADITWEVGTCAEPVLVEVDFGAVDAVVTDRKTGELIATATAADFATVLKNNLSKNIVATLLKDVVADVPSSNAITGNLKIDLNGHKLTYTGSSHIFTPMEKSVVRITGGSLAVDVKSGNNLAMMNYASCFFIDNLDSFTVSEAVLFDQRNGYIRISDCDNIESAKLIANPKSGGRTPSTFELLNSNCTVLSGDAFSTGNANQSKVGRYGSFNTRVVIDNCTVNAPAGGLVSLEAHANASGSKTDGVYTETTNENYLRNDNDFLLVVNSSEINVKGNLVNGNLTTVTNVNNGAPANGLTLDINVDITDSKISAARLLSQTGGKTGVDYKYSAYVDVVESDLDLTEKTFVDKAITDENATVELNFDGECNLTTNKLVADGVAGAKINVKAPYLIINRSLSEEHNYTHIVTTKCAPYPIVINGEETEMQWYAEDVLTVDDLPDDLLPPDNKYVSYKWAYNDNGAFEAVKTGDIPVKANLVLKNNLNFNVYIPADLDAETYDTVTVNGEAVALKDVSVDGVAYKLIEITDVNPANADEKVRVQLTAYIDGARIERITKRISVIDYAAAALESADVSADEKALIASVVNYIDAAQKYAGKASFAVNKLVASEEYKNALPEASESSSAINEISALGVFDRVYLALDSSFVYKFVTKADFEGTISVAYLKDGVEVTESFNVGAMDIVRIKVDARDLLGAIKVTVNGSTGSYTVASYLASVSAAHPEAAALADAIELYASVAKAFANK